MIGFALSYNSNSQTNTDIDTLRQSNEKNRAEADLAEFRLHFNTDIFALVYKIQTSIVPAAQTAIQQTVPSSYSVVLGVAVDIPVNSMANTYSSSDVVPLNIDYPDECKSIIKFPIKYDLKTYGLTADDMGPFSNLLELTSHHLNTTVMTRHSVQALPPDDASARIEALKSKVADIKAAYAKGVAKACSDMKDSDEMGVVRKDVVILENIHDEQQKIGKIAETSSDASPKQDSSFAYVLLFNRFGPFVVIFFFSSLLITLYKYNSRLVSFYYGRVFAIEALTGKVTAENFASTAAIFSPDLIDFGKGPRSPIELAADVAKAAAEQAVAAVKPKTE